MTTVCFGPDVSDPKSVANRFAVGCLAWIATGFATIATGPSHAASIPRPSSPSPVTKLPAYVTDVTGKRVRVVGPQFYPNPKALTFPGGRELPRRPGYPQVISGKRH